MSDFSRELRAPFDRRAEDRMWHRIAARSAVRTRPRKTGALGIALGFAAALALLVGLVARPTPTPHLLGVPRPAALLEATGGVATNLASTTFADGTRIDGAPRPTLVENGLMGVRVTQDAGSVTYDAHATRGWTIAVHGTTVRFVDAQVTVGRLVDRTTIAVARGEVVLDGAHVPTSSSHLHAGMLVELLDDDAAAPTALTPPKVNAPPSAVASWRALEARGEHGLAYDALGEKGVKGALAGASVDDEFALADVARLSGHPRDAIAPLSAILRDHGGDPRAALAAFTLGRVEADDLGEWGPAALAFQRAIDLHVPGGLDEIAFVRLVEAKSRLGDREGARAAYAQAKSRSPSAEHDRAMRQWIDPE